jgi:hypothetical protein
LFCARGPKPRRYRFVGEGLGERIIVGSIVAGKIMVEMANDGSIA